MSFIFNKKKFLIRLNIYFFNTFSIWVMWKFLSFGTPGDPVKTSI